MRLLANQLKEINENLPDLNIDLDWDHGQGRYENQDYQIEVSGYLLSVDITCFGDAIERPGRFMEEPSYTNHSYSTTIYSITVYDNEGDKLLINDKQFRSIEHNLINNIYIL